jgi:Xaa-Pro aminopeptidase
MRQERLEKLRQEMKAGEIGACLLTGFTGIGYATGQWSFQFPQLDYVLVSLEQDSVIWQISGAFQHMRDMEPWSNHPENIRVSKIWQGWDDGGARCQAKLFAADIDQAMKELGLQGEKLGLYGPFDSYAVCALKDLGIEIVDATRIVQKARMIKTRDEIACWKMAASAADAAWYAIYDRMRPGMTAPQLSSIASEVGHSLGVDWPALAAFFTGPWDFPRGFTSTDRVIQVGDVVHGDVFGFSYMGYRTCHYRTFKVGTKPTSKEMDWYKQMG